MLQREIEVRDLGRQDRVDQPVVERGRVEVEQSHPPHALCDLGHEFEDAVGLRARLRRSIATVRGEVLRDKNDLGGIERVDLGQDGGELARALAPTERRNGTEPAPAVATLGNLDVRPRRLRRRAGQLEQIECRHRLARTEGDRSGAIRGDVHAEAGDYVDLRHGLGQLGSAALSEATRDSQPSAGAPALAEREDCVNRLLPRRLDESAGVDDDQVGFVRSGRLGVTRLRQTTRKLGGVDLVLRATERGDPI